MELYKEFVTEQLNADGTLAGLDFHPPENFNFGYDVVDAWAQREPSKKAMIWVSKDFQERIFTFGEMSELSNKAANWFLKEGIKKGDRVMLVLRREYYFWIAIVALHKIGAVVVPATDQLKKKDYVYRFGAAEISAVVCTSYGATCDEVDAACENITTSVLRVVAGAKREGWLDFSSLFDCSSKLERVPTSKDETMIMYFTSGTTGYPKIAMHDHTYALAHFTTAKWWHNLHEKSLHLTVADTGWGKAVWGKLYGQWIVGACVFTFDFDRFHQHELLSLMEKYHVTSFCAPPTIYRFMIKEDISGFDLSALEYATTAGEALNPEVYNKFYEATGLKLMEGFGQTETTLVVANLKGSVPKAGSMGKPNPQYRVRVVDGEGNDAAIGDVGEICICTDEKKPLGLYCGYYHNPAQTAATWHDGLYHTGDTVWCDEDGYLWYYGRTDDLIKSSGYRIGPFELESVLMELPYVMECAITGVPDPTRGQVVKATIVLRKGVEGTEVLVKEIQEYVKKATAPYKYPRIVEFVEELPKTISGKIRKVELRG